MSGLKYFILIVLYFTTYCCCDFSEIVNINSIIDNSTQLPTFDDQILSGKQQICNLKFGTIASNPIDRQV